MSAEAEEITLQTVNSVTLTRDSDGSLILHCPPNGTLTHSISSEFFLESFEHAAIFIDLLFYPFVGQYT